MDASRFNSVQPSVIFCLQHMALPSNFAPAGHSSRRRGFLFWLAAAIALAAAIYPLYVIRPFRYQEPGELRAALWLVRWAPWITFISALIVLWLTPARWRASAGKLPAWLRRTGIVLVLLFVGVSVVASRVNIFEKMFHPISSLRFLPVAQAKLAPDDMLMAVTIGGESHAYPIREMAYHHVVNDVVGGTPVVGTY